MLKTVTLTIILRGLELEESEIDETATEVLDEATREGFADVEVNVFEEKSFNTIPGQIG